MNDKAAPPEIVPVHIKTIFELKFVLFHLPSLQHFDNRSLMMSERKISLQFVNSIIFNHKIKFVFLLLHCSTCC